MRKPRLVVPGHPHHVIWRGNNRRRLFSYPNDYHSFLRYLRAALDKHGCAMHALALMANHAHLVLTPSTLDGLTQLSHSVGMRYALHRNRQHGDTGKLFESRFRSFPILSDSKLAATLAYVELNPVRAGLRDDPVYRWSTYALHVGRGELASVPRSLWTPSPWYLGLGYDRETRFAEFVAAVRATDEPEPPARDRRLRRPDESRAT